jgi:hypothetical protein
VFVEFILGVEFRHQAGVLVSRYPFNRKGFKKMCSQIHQAIKWGAHSVTITDGNIGVNFTGMEAGLGVSPSELRNRIDLVLSDLTLKKMDKERGASASA